MFKNRWLCVAGKELHPGVLREGKHGWLLDIEVRPRSNVSGITGFDEWRGRFIVQVRSAAQKGKANLEVQRVVAEALCVEDVVIVSGKKSHSKTVAFTADSDVMGSVKRYLLELM